MADNSGVRDLKIAIETLESQRDLLGGEVADTSLAALQEKLTALEGKKREPGEQLRKYVTVMFADVSGFTSSVGLIPLAFEALRFKSKAFADLGQKGKAILILLVMKNDEALPEHEKEEVADMLSELKESMSVEEFRYISRQADSMDFSAISSDLPPD